MSKRILIDGRFIGVGESMTRYCLEIVQGILKLDHENQYTLLIRPVGEKNAEQFFKSEIRMSKSETNSKIENLNLNIEILDIPHYSLAEQTQLLKYLNKEKFDLVHFIQFNHPIRYKGKFVVTIHDLTLIGHLHREPLHKRLAFGTVMKSAAKNSAKIITISNTSKEEIIEYYGVPKEKIEVTYLAVDPKYQPASRISNFDTRISDFHQKYGIYDEYFLYTGMWKKHKNLIRLLKAFEKFQEIRNNPPAAGQTNSNDAISKIQLVLVGKIDKEEPEVIALIDKINEKISNEMSNASNVQNCHSELDSESSVNSAIVTTGYIEEDELPIAYAGAIAYVIPSLSEGFGLPPLEAMACGTPVLSSNVSAMPEILGQAPLYFDPYDIDDIAIKMQQIDSDEQTRVNLSARGLEQVKKYDWGKTAEGTLDMYKQILYER